MFLFFSQRYYITYTLSTSFKNKLFWKKYYSYGTNYFNFNMTSMRKSGQKICNAITFG